jgi:hypothetical protein
MKFREIFQILGDIFANIPVPPTYKSAFTPRHLATGLLRSARNDDSPDDPPAFIVKLTRQPAPQPTRQLSRKTHSSDLSHGTLASPQINAIPHCSFLTAHS